MIVHVEPENQQYPASKASLRISGSTDILCTLGPASLTESVITRLEELGVSLFRLNLSHTRTEDIAAVLEFIQSQTSVPICLDTEGAQVRTGHLADGKILLRENRIVHICRQLVPGDSSTFNLYPPFIVDELELGDLIRLDASVLGQVIEIQRNRVTLRILCGGELGQNKAVTIERDIPMPALTRKDLQALCIGKKMGVRHVALSFANRGSDVDEIREVFGLDAFVISKIECRNGLQHLDQLASKSDALLIDRGDLSRQVPIEQLPKLQKNIIACAGKRGRKVYVATNLMESMVTLPFPTRAEVNDVYNTLADGADGLVLAAETAVGKHPVGCTSMIVKIIREFENGFKRNPSSSPEAPISLLVDPLGGRLVHRERTPTEINNLDGLQSLVVSDTDLMDCELIANGTYSPLTGFMCRATLESVLDTNRLPSGVPWTMPIVLQVKPECAATLRVGDTVALTNSFGRVHATLDVEEIYSIDFDSLCARWFGTTSTAHPGVTRLAGGSNLFVGGEISLIEQMDSPLNQYKLTPAAARFIFAQKGWNRVVGFHGRNVPHRAHEYIQIKALEKTHADGLFISPVIGPRKPGDFLPDPIIKSYQMLIDFGFYPQGKVMLSCLPTYPRYCGPREAVFTAICHKNRGCSHFIVGRDHTGVGDFYSDDAMRQLFDTLGDIGVTPVFFDSVGYDPKTQKYCSLDSAGIEKISGSIIREKLRQGIELPNWYMREIVQDMLRTAMANGDKVFCE